MRAALGFDEPLYGPVPAIEHGKSPDTFLILAHGPLPLRLSAFAFLSSNSRDLCARSTAQTALRAVLPLTPPRPLLPQPKPWGRGGAKRFGEGAPTPPAKALVARGARGLEVSVGWLERALQRDPPSSTE